ncbi:DUF3237 domain-containing protein [Rouxiella badensis]|jgi:hypothetical protein|uniref:Uncharacterized protein n=1 Tax=Rouxiella badensis TaxID=1646377 RepID=A0A1X0WIR5_9GAMM|nr:DUF3237 domain-containing protein [Rouxiella badensis]MCC3703979.1 DUF3237 domain-containing protein [Rouxiella badensis]MCC3719000.1 DUF3237 domain-containing protein [Rouxiella badensis]MCC3729054.1 DUF3237 domain-containing protein [Rouxiella badensis]MCC3733587.1 DUF3237 domain-containing protein [Rouxiella badensis]MCC3740605.1 DUF3237 domain-containing protein [Rouxiella badensis]
MHPELKHSFSVEIKVDKPIVVNATAEGGKRQLIAILEGEVSGRLRGQVLPGGIDSQIIHPDGTCQLSARYGLETSEGRVYVENNGIRRIPAEWREKLFSDDMSFFNLIPQEEIYFRAVPKFEVYSEALRWMTESIFICTGQRTAQGVSLKFYELT